MVSSLAKERNGFSKRIEPSFNSSILFLIFFRIGCYDRTVVMVVRVREFISLIWNTRVENERNSLFDQPGYMSVGKLAG